MNILVACEESKVATIELRKLGDEAYSCDIEQCYGGAQEEWRIIPQFVDYEASSFGRIRSREREIVYSDGRKRTYKSKILKPGVSAGYLFVNICKNGKIKSVKVHSLVASAFIGKKPEKFDVCHINGNRTDNRISNLEYGSRSKNNLDGYRIRGFVNKNQKLSPAIVAEIKKKLLLGVSQRELAREYMVCKSTISAIKKNKLYGWIENEC